LTGGFCIPYILDMRAAVHRLLVLGHRGYRASFPENTLLAFREALAAGADGIECDLQKSADGRYMIIHDSSTERVTGSRLDVGRSSSGTLRALNAGRGERLPFLEEMLAALPPRAYLDLELKEETLLQEDTEPIARILDASIERDRLMVSSFALRLLVPFRRRGFTVGLLVGEETAARGLRGLAADLLRLRPQFVNLPVDVMRIFGARRAGVLFRILRALGFSLLFWTVNSADDAEVLAPHARIIVTDEVERIRKTTDS
jgi:glycerophosphoryl diester phosphodiesterase